MKLRPYQNDLFGQTRQHMRQGCRSVLIQSPTGSGKTALTVAMFAAARIRGRRCWFVVHRRELLNQSILAFRDAGIPVGVIAAGYAPDSSQLIQVVMVGSVSRRMGTVLAPDLIVWDECHHAASKSWSTIMRAYPAAYHIGLTATPERADGQGLGEHFQTMVVGPSVRWLIDAGYLCDYKYYAPNTVDLSTVNIKMGDFDTSSAAHAMDKPSITGDAISHYQRLASGERALMFCCNILHSQHSVAQFLDAGIAAEHVDGKTPMAERDAAMARYASGETQVLSNVGLFAEGVNVPESVVAILLRPTHSTCLFLQQLGRIFRTATGKTRAIINDHVNNVSRHGLPDMERQWSLESKKRKPGASKSEIVVRTCPMCYACWPAGVQRCNHCGHEFIAKERKIEQVEGELVELTDQQKLQMRHASKAEQGAAGSLAELIALGKKRGYTNPEGWARHIIVSRQRKPGVRGDPKNKFDFTQERLEAVPAPEKGATFVYDARQPGLAMIVTSTGHKAFYLYRRILGGKSVSLKLGNLTDLTVEQARQIVKDQEPAIAKGDVDSVIKSLRKSRR